MKKNNTELEGCISIRFEQLLDLLKAKHKKNINLDHFGKPDQQRPKNELRIRLDVLTKLILKSDYTDDPGCKKEIDRIAYNGICNLPFPEEKKIIDKLNKIKFG